jgi:hypothetical protein
MDPRILDVDTTWRWVVSFTARTLYLRDKSPRYPLNRRLGEPQNWSRRHETKKNLTRIGTRTPTLRPSSPYLIAILTAVFCQSLQVEKKIVHDHFLPRSLSTLFTNYPVSRHYMYILRYWQLFIEIETDTILQPCHCKLLNTVWSTAPWNIVQSNLNLYPSRVFSLGVSRSKFLFRDLLHVLQTGLAPTSVPLCLHSKLVMFCRSNGHSQTNSCWNRNRGQSQAKFARLSVPSNGPLPRLRGFFSWDVGCPSKGSWPQN